VIFLFIILGSFAAEVSAREMPLLKTLPEAVREIPPLKMLQEYDDFVIDKLVHGFWYIAGPIAGLSEFVKRYVIGVIVAILGMGMILVLFFMNRDQRIPENNEEGAAHLKIPYVEFSIHGPGFFIGVLGAFAVIVSGMALAIWDVS